MKSNLTNIGACALERRYIRWYGRKEIDKNGILLNKAEGGEGGNGICSLETRKKISKSRKGKLTGDDKPSRRPEVRAKLALPRRKRISLKQPKLPIKGRTYIEIYGEEKAKELKLMRYNVGKHRKINIPKKYSICEHCNKIFDHGNLKRHRIRNNLEWIYQ